MYQDIVSNFFEYQIALKMFHFQTELYSGHKTADAISDQYRLLFDSFMEVLQGIKDIRITVKKDAFVPLGNVKTKNEMMKINHNVIKFFTQLKKEFKKHTDLNNILDELISVVNRFNYLLSFN
jgi:hypothetical protein